MAKTLIIILTLVWPEVASSIPGGGVMRSFFFLKMHDFLMVTLKMHDFLMVIEIFLFFPKIVEFC